MKVQRFDTGIKIKTIFTAGIVAALACIYCAGPSTTRAEQWYPDTWYSEDNVYQNRALGFSLHFKGRWHIVTEPEDMNETGRDFFAQLHESSSELLFMGTTADSAKACLGIASQLNYPNRLFAQKTREANLEDIDQDYGLSQFIAHKHDMVKWEYRIGSHSFVEFFFLHDTYNVRIRFWTKARIFSNFLPVFEGIMTSLEYTYGY